MEARELIQRIYDHVEVGDVDKATIVYLRLARKIGDVFNVVMFLREMYPDRSQLQRAFFDETQQLGDDARKFVWDNTGDRWIEERTLSFSLDSDVPDKNVLAMGIGELKREVEQMEQSIEDLRLPPGMGEFDTAAFTDRYGSLKGDMRLKIRACYTVIERVRTRCLYYASRVEAQLQAQQQTSNLVEGLQTEVNNHYAVRADSVYQKLHKATSLISSRNPEDHALLLTTIRRAIKAVADYHFPPASEPVVCRDGQTRVLGEEQYLNRLQEFCAQRFGASGSSKLLQAEVEYLSVFVKRVDKIASKGVHADVTAVEARQGLLGLYIFLSNLIAKLNEPSDQGRGDVESLGGGVAVGRDNGPNGLNPK